MIQIQSYSNDKEKSNNGSQQKEKTWNLWKSEFSAFVDGVNMVGLKYVFRDGASLVRRGVWLLLVLIGIAAFAYQLENRIMYYASYPTAVNVKINHPTTLQFPTVTVCSENIMSKSRLTTHGLLGVMEQAFPLWLVRSEARDVDMDALLNLHHNYDADELAKLVSPPIALRTGTFNIDHCQREDFTTVSTSSGECLQYNTNGTKYLDQAGLVYGLTLIIYDNQSDYGIINSPAKGFRVLIHEHAEYPAVEQQALHVSSGVQSIALTVRNVTMLPHPYGNCIDDPMYRRSVCLARCRASYYLSTCGCGVHYLPLHELNYNRTCTVYDEVICLGNATAEWYKRGVESTCNCPQQCNTITYQHTIHTTSISDRFSEIAVDYLRINDAAEEFLDSNTILTVYFSELTSEEMTDVPSYTQFALFCDVGGALGLVLGSTVLTLVEFGDFFATLLWNFASSSKSHKSKPQNQVYP